MNKTKENIIENTPDDFADWYKDEIFELYYCGMCGLYFEKPTGNLYCPNGCDKKELEKCDDVYNLLHDKALEYFGTRECRWCKGRGYQYVERSSSLSYGSPDCNGTGEVIDV